MKVFKISKNGLEKAQATKTIANNGAEYYSLLHGEDGRGRWQVRIPLAARQFPDPCDHGERLELIDEYSLVDLKKKDPRGNNIYLLTLGEDDGKQLILWNLSPGFRGSASWKVSGQAEVISVGQEAQGAAGRMGGADCPIVHVTGPCKLTWSRFGRLYGDESEWVAEFDGKEWTVLPCHQCAAEEAALNY
jgi:hypothetical protein